MLLDPFTIILMTSLMGCAMSVVLYSAHLSFPSEIQGLRHWAGGLLLSVTAVLFYGSRGLILPEHISLLCANSVLLWGLGLTMIGTQRFYGRPENWRLFHAVWAVGMVTIAYWLIRDPDFAARVTVFSLLAFVFYFSQFLTIWKHGERHFSTRFFGTLMLFQSVVVLTRGILAFTGGIGQVNLLKPGPFQSLYLATGNFMSLLLTVAFMTVATRRLQTILERRSSLDPLTQVLNRRGFADIYARERVLMRRAPTVMTLLSVDLDFFKQINDRHGHAAGDRVLIDVAVVIGKVLRASDHLARFGGEEFVVLLPDTGLAMAQQVAERIQIALRLPRTAAAGAHKGPALPAYTVSVGIASQTDPEEELEGIMMRADKALYRAKEGGRDRIEIMIDPAPPAWQGVPGFS